MSIGGKRAAALGLSVRSRAAVAGVADLPRNVWRELGRLGVRCLELTLPEDPGDEDFFAFAGELLGRGFELSFHTPYPNALDLQDFVDGRDRVGDYYRAWLRSLRRLPLSLPGPVLVVHGVNAAGVTPGVQSRARATSVAFLRWLAGESIRLETPLRLAFEVRPRRAGWTKVGTTCAEVLAVVDEVTAGNVGICWDVGHTIMNLARQDDIRPPPKAFIARTIHTHLHEATAERDHLPVTPPAPRLRQALGLLATAGYAEALVLECAFSCWEEVMLGVTTIRRLWEEVRGSRAPSPKRL